MTGVYRSRTCAARFRWMTGFCVSVIPMLVLASTVFATPAAGAADPPPDLKAIQELARAAPADTPFAEEKRHAAMRLAALGFGARAGLARRGWEIDGLLDRHAARLSGIYRFRDLMLRESGFAVLPPVVAETRAAFRLGRGHARAATAQRVLRIVEPARIAGAPPSWRDYLRRSWPEAASPAAVLFPRGAEETARWRRWLAEGWAHGAALAEDIFAADLDRLNRTFEGIVRWHRLHRAGMVSAPGLEAFYTGVAGHERLMRIAGTAVELTRPARFSLDAGTWRMPAGGDTP